MNNLLTILTPLIIGFGAIAVFALARREKTRKNDKLNRRDFTARSTYTWGVVMITINTVIALLLILGNIEDPFGIGFNIFLGVLFAIFSLGILQAFRERVIVKEETITYVPAIGKPKQYTFDAIEKIEKRKTGIYVYVNGKKAYTLDPSGIGSLLFVEIYKTR